MKDSGMELGFWIVFGREAVLRTQAEWTVWLEENGLDTELNGCGCLEDFLMFWRLGLGYGIVG